MRENAACSFLIIVAICLLTGGPAVAGEDTVKLLIVYYSSSGNTEQMAEAVADGAKRIDGTIVSMKTVDEVVKEDFASADAIVLGSPVYWANMAGPMKTFIDDWAFKYQAKLFGKVGGAFATGGLKSGGSQLVVVSLLSAMLMNGMIVVGPLYEQWGALGATALTASSDNGVEDDEIKEAQLLGERVAEIAGLLKRARALEASGQD